MNKENKILSNKNSIWEDIPGKKKVLIMMSGGVDSTAAALMLQEYGYNVAGFTMTFLENSNVILKAERACKKIGIPHFYTDITEAFREYVTTPFHKAYLSGKTPNPCADCNEKIKFGLLLKLVEEKWGDNILIATGHYASIHNQKGEYFLAKAKNRNKDQSYFMSGISKKYLPRLMFPLNGIENKNQTREYLRAKGIEIADEKESMELCFAGEKSYRDLIYAPNVQGEVVDIKGNVLGKHNGITSFTIGQRKGLGIASQNPLYVIKIDARNNRVVVAERDAAFKTEVFAHNTNILAPKICKEKDIRLFGKVRSQGKPSPCTIKEINTEKQTITVEFDVPIFAPASGQRLVVYTEEGIVVVGAVID